MDKGVTGLKKVGGLILPMLAKPGDFAGLGPFALGALRVLALVVTLGVLTGVNRILRLNQFLEPPRNDLGYFWLPLLFLLLSTICWLVWWLWGQLGPGKMGDSFPDIEQAWREVVRALERSGIGLNEAPLFLVLGRPQGSEAALFDGAELALKVRGQPNRDDAPLRVYANREAIFITCAEASILGRQALVSDSPDYEAPSPSSVSLGDNEAEFMTLGPGVGGNEDASAILARARLQGRGPGQLLEEELRALGRLSTDRETTAGGGDSPSGSTRANQVRDKAELELQSARLGHLGRLIARDRRPYCPLNGILMLIPLSATNSDQSATRVGLLCQRDLAAIRASTQVRCPVFALACDLENLPGFRELIERMPEDQRRRRMGQRFPLIPDVDASALPAILEGGVQWIADKQLPARVDSLWRVEVGTELSMADAVLGNVRLYQLLRQIRDRHRRLGRVLSRAVITDGVPTTMLGGCYLAGTGVDPKTEQAFIPGVFRRLMENQDLVSWTPELQGQETRYNRWTRTGYLALGILTSLCAALVVYVLVFASQSGSK